MKQGRFSETLHLMVISVLCVTLASAPNPASAPLTMPPAWPSSQSRRLPYMQIPLVQRLRGGVMRKRYTIFEVSPGDNFEDAIASTVDTKGEVRVRAGRYSWDEQIVLADRERLVLSAELPDGGGAVSKASGVGFEWSRQGLRPTLCGQWLMTEKSHGAICDYLCLSFDPILSPKANMTTFHGQTCLDIWSGPWYLENITVYSHGGIAMASADAGDVQSRRCAYGGEADAPGNAMQALFCCFKELPWHSLLCLSAASKTF